MKINNFHQENMKINKEILRSLQNNTNKSLKHINSEIDSLLIDFGVNFQAIIDLTQAALIILI
jgi:DNA polymerase III delta subunit